MFLLLSRRHFGHPQQVVPVLAIETDVLNLCLDESGLRSSVSTGRDPFVEIQGLKLGKSGEIPKLNLYVQIFH